MALDGLAGLWLAKGQDNKDCELVVGVFVAIPERLLELWLSRLACFYPFGPCFALLLAGRPADGTSTQALAHGHFPIALLLLLLQPLAVATALRLGAVGPRGGAKELCLMREREWKLK